MYSEMAGASFSQDQFSCSVCLDLLKDPISNIANIVEKMKKTNLQTAHPAHTGSGDVECDVCTGRKYKAVKSCVECLNSYCQSHLEQHDHLFKNRRHHLMDPTRLHEMICPKHGKELEIYCRTDQQSICYPCLMDEHKNHDTVTAEAERTVKQRILSETQTRFQQQIQGKQKQLQELRDSVKSHERSAQTAVDNSERIFNELIRSIERSRTEVIQLIRDQEKAAVSRAEGLLEQLEQEIHVLRRRDSELEQLSHTDNNIHFLQMFQFISKHPESTDICSTTVSSPLSFHDIAKSISQLTEKLEGFCKKELEKISDRVACIETTPSSELKCRNEFLKCSCQLTLDSDTASRFLHLSEGNRAAAFTETPQQYPAHPQRFDSCVQVLCSESVCGRCYWEIKWSGNKGVCLSVSYKNISRTGLLNECLFGFNNQSWGLYCLPSNYIFVHNKMMTEIPVFSRSSRIGVYVDHSAGTLCFYSISGKMTLIHKVQTTFTQPLYPGFGFNTGSKVKLC